MALNASSATQLGCVTELSEDELLLQTSVRRFAAEVVTPHVRTMD
jgi:hypothetical protein